MNKLPNYIFIITDQQRADHLGCYGNNIVKTPNIDSLAEQGIRFTNFYVANPICMCNRASILTGRMPSLHGVRHNGIPLSMDSTTFTDILRDEGYRTALIGKSHIQNMTGLPAALKYNVKDGNKAPSEKLREANKRLRTGLQYEQELTSRWRENPAHRVFTPFYGFDEVIIANEHGDLVTGDYEVWLNEKCQNANELIGSNNAIPDPRYSSPQAWRTRIPEELYPTSFIKNKSCEFIENHAKNKNTSPFFLMVSFPDPHHPFTPPGKYWDMYSPDIIPLPTSFGKGDIPPIKKLKKAAHEGKDFRKGQDPFIVNEREVREITALTYGSISMIDDAVGSIINCLKENNLDDNTVICFTSDHGDYMGDHSLMLKLLMHYQGLIKVPFIWFDPRNIKNSEVNNELSGSIDIATTILNNSKIQPFNGMQGVNLLDSFTRKGMLIEEDSQRPMIAFDKPQRVRTYVTKKWRISVRQGEEWGELYHLENDPDEINNLWNNADYFDIKNKLIQDMLNNIISLQDNSPMPSYRA